MADSCVFCERMAHGQHRRLTDAAGAFEPLNPVTPGHMLVVPYRHVAHAAEDPKTSADAMYAAALVAAEIGDCNIITSRGAAATQTVHHLHIHIVPRREGDGLALPWTGQARG